MQTIVMQRNASAAASLQQDAPGLGTSMYAQYDLQACATTSNTVRGRRHIATPTRKLAGPAACLAEWLDLSDPCYAISTA